MILSLHSATLALVFLANLDFDDQVLGQAEQQLKTIAASTLETNSTRDHELFCPELESILEASKNPDKERKKAAAKLAKDLDKKAPAGKAWRTHELRARLLQPIDVKLAHEAFLKAVASYPKVEYATPESQSYFPVLYPRLFATTWTLKGRKKAESALLETLEDDPRYAAFLPEAIEETYLQQAACEELKEFWQAVANVLKDRSPEQAQALRTRAIPDVRLLNGDPQKLFVVIGAEVPTDATRKLVLILPGGSGKALDCLPWMQTLTQGLTDEYLFAVLSSPTWSAAQAKGFVRVTEEYTRTYKAKFAVESFVRDVASMLRKQDKSLFEAYLFAWSSGGPVIYATILDKDDTFAGAYVLGGIFEPKPSTYKYAKGKRFYLEQGEQDRITHYRFAEEAEKTLTGHGAATKLVPFPGGHGFVMPNPAQCLAKALQWLTQ